MIWISCIIFRIFLLTKKNIMERFLTLNLSKSKVSSILFTKLILSLNAKISKRNSVNWKINLKIRKKQKIKFWAKVRLCYKKNSKKRTKWRPRILCLFSILLWMLYLDIFFNHRITILWILKKISKISFNKNYQGLLKKKEIFI